MEKKTVNPWLLDPKALYMLDGDATVRKILKELGVPNLFAGASEFDAIHALVAFDNHPTHWIIVHLWQGVPSYSPNHGVNRFVESPDPNGLLFQAIPKATTSRAKMEIKLTAELRDMEATVPLEFQQLPPRSH